MIARKRFGTWTKAFAGLAVVTVLGIGPGAAQSAKQASTGSAQPTLLGQYGDWGAYTASPDGKKTCFALAKPTSSHTDPPNRKRDPAYVFVSNRPNENVTNEVSVIIGYPFKPNVDASAVIGSATFDMYTQDDGAWVKNVADEAKMVEAMRKGAEMTIKGVSTHGTKTTDVYSLKGVTDAIERAAKACK